MLDGLSFGVRADRFERAWDNVGEILGFEHDRPDKIWKEGPDNLWGLAQNSFLVVECKNQVELTRSYINKHETAQLNGSVAWFQKKYKDARCFNVMIIPTHKVQKGAYFVSNDVGIMNSNLLSKFKKRISAFISEFRNFNLQELSEEKVQSLIERAQAHTGVDRTRFCQANQFTLTAHQPNSGVPVLCQNDVGTRIETREHVKQPFAKLGELP